MLRPRSYIMSLFGFLLGLSTALSAQFLTPEETVKIPPPADVPAAPAVPARPEPQRIPPPPTPPIPQPPAPAATESDAYFADFAAYSREKNIILTWHLARGRTIDRRIQIYRFTEEPRVIHDISRGILIAKLSGEINLYEDVPPAKGTYYYAIFVESVRGLEPASFNISRNLVGPVAFNPTAASAVTPPDNKEIAPPPQKYVRPDFESKEAEESEEEEPTATELTAEEKHSRGINAVIRRTFFRGKYQQAVRELRPFLRNSSARVRAKAMFYTGLARYRMGQYERALKYFDHPLTRKFYRRNAEFWIRKTTENLR